MGNKPNNDVNQEDNELPKQIEKVDKSQPVENKSETKEATTNQQQGKHVKGGSFNPGLIISKGVSSKKELAKVEQLGEITLVTLHKYGCNNADRRLLSLFGIVFDVTAAVQKYGPEGSYKDFAGHDITLSLGSGKLEQKWLDRFVQMNDKQIESAQGWSEFYESQYPKAGTLKKWKDDQSKWPALTEEEQEELNAECLIIDLYVFFTLYNMSHSLQGAANLEFMKSEPLYSGDIDPYPHTSSTHGVHAQSASAHTTPIKDFYLPPRIGLDLGSASVDNLDPPDSKQHNRHSRRSRSKGKVENNTSREAGHTPPPRPSNANIRSFGDLVKDTDKQEGPINWWNLKVKMPDDNTMNILSPHRIPVPTTPTTPPYIVKTPDGLRISLFDVDLDDEKKLSELGIDEQKKEYILSLKKEQEEKEKQDDHEMKTILETNYNNSSESESTDEFTAKHNPDGTTILVMSQPIEIKPKKRSKTPHDPSTPTLVMFDWGANDDPYQLMDNYTAPASNNLTQEFHEGRISLQDMRLYHSARVMGVSQPNIHSNSIHDDDDTIRKAQTTRRGHLLSDTAAIKRHSEIIRSHTARRTAKSGRKSRRKSRPNRLQADDTGNLTRSASVDGSSKFKKLKDRTGKNKRHSTNRFKKKKRKRQPVPKSDVLTATRPTNEFFDGLAPLDINAAATSSNPVRKSRVRFKSEPRLEESLEENDEEYDEKDVVHDIIGDILSNNNSKEKKEVRLNINTPTSQQSNLSITEHDPEIDEELEAPITIKKPMAIGIANIVLNAKSADAAYDTKQESRDDEDEDDENDPNIMHLVMVSDNQREEEEDDFEDDESYTDDDEYEDDSEDSYMRHRYDSSSGDSSDNPGPLKNPFAIEEIVPVSPDEAASPDTVPPRIAMPANSNKLNLGKGPAVFIGADGNIMQSGTLDNSTLRSRNQEDKHLAHSPLLMNNDDAVSAFLAQYIPAFYTSNPWMLSPTFEIAQYKDLKNLNLFIYKTLRLLDKDDSNHPTQARNIKMKTDLNWDLRIDGIASCYISDELMTNVIHYVSFPHDLDPQSPIKGFRDKNKSSKTHLLGLIKSTQSLVCEPVSPVTTKLKNGYSTTSNALANSVTHTPRHSNISIATASKRDTANKMQIDDKLKHLAVNITPKTDKEDNEYFDDNESDPTLHDHNNLLLAASQHKHRRSICKCCDIHNLRRSLNRNDGCQKTCHRLIYNVFYKYGSLMLFCLIYFAILMFAICERIYFPLLAYDDMHINNDIDINLLVIVVTGRIMLTSLILMLISRMVAFQSWLMETCALQSRFIVRNLFCNSYAHLILSWFGIFLMILIHILFASTTSYATETLQLDVVDIVRISLVLIAIASIIASNCGGTYYSLYSTSLQRMERNSCCNRCESILCNKTFDYGQQKHTSLYKVSHIISGTVLLIVFYLDIDYIGVYYVLSLFLFLFVVDRFVFLFNSSKVLRSADLNILPIDHQFKILFVNNNEQKMWIEPGDIYYISSQSLWSFGRPSVFFSKNNYNSIGCIMRVHRNNTLSNSMERVKWNFNFLERILDNEFIPVFRGPYRNNSIYHQLIEKIDAKLHLHRYHRRSIQYLIAVDEGIAYQLEYLNYLQSHGFDKMPFPTHIIFCTTSKALFNYIATNMQLLFIEMEDLTVECKLLPSNINLIPNVDEMVSYYKNDRSRRRKKKQKKQQQQDADPELDTPLNDDFKDAENDDSDINAHDIMQEMEYDILHYLSIPHILYHHNLKKYYEDHKHSKLSANLREKYEFEVSPSSEEEMHNATTANNKPFDEVNNEDIGIEMYYSGIPFVSNCLNNVCKICRIPYYTQNIY